MGFMRIGGLLALALALAAGCDRESRLRGSTGAADVSTPPIPKSSTSSANAADAAALRGEIRRLEQEALTLTAVSRMKLTDSQARSLLDLARKAWELESDLDDVREKAIKAFAALREEAIRNAGFSNETQRTAMRARRRIRIARNAFCESVAEIEKHAGITDDQMALLASTQPENPNLLGRRFAPTEPPEGGDDADILDELSRIDIQKFGTLDALGQFLLSPAAAEALARRLGEKLDVAARRRAADASREADEKIRAVRSEINLINLINGMNYSVHQLAHLAEYARQAGRERDAAVDMGAALRYRDALAGIVEELQRGGDPEPARMRQATALREQAFHDIAKSTLIEALVASVKEVLFENQKNLLVPYRPCLVPPVELRNPVLVGQANDGDQAKRMLDAARLIAPAAWGDRVEKFVEDAFEDIEWHGGEFPVAEREMKKKAFQDLLERARSLSDVDYQLQKSELAAEVAPFYRCRVLQSRLVQVRGDDPVLGEKIRSFLLDPSGVPLYEARMAQLKEASVGKPVDLDKISPAPHCKDGKCAIEER